MGDQNLPSKLEQQTLHHRRSLTKSFRMRIIIILAAIVAVVSLGISNAHALNAVNIGSRCR
jgi:hypothetical protein